MGKIWAGLGFIFTLLSLYLGIVFVPALNAWNTSKISMARANATIESCLQKIASPPNVVLTLKKPGNPEDCAPSALARQAHSQDFFASGPAQELIILLLALVLAVGFFYLYRRSVNSAN